ncbi:MAG: 3-phosphoglycerate dehydrogenase [Candidatus Altiarchaeota archaeon]|nr:3-phosphoglycerate dehydrogenase [Candidatus Altiarchaeota archaeon]
MVQLRGEFPESFIHSLEDNHQNVLVVRYPEGVNEDTLPQGIDTVIAVSHGVDNIDEEFLKSKEINFHRVPAGAIDVAEFCVSSAITLLRRLPVSRVQEWLRPEGKRLSGKTWGIVGLGIIGKELAKVINGLGCKLLAYDPYVKSELVVKSLDELLGADIVSIHVPLTKETKGIINNDFISKFKGILIDVSRGGVVDTEAVFDALKSGTMYGAALDVFPEEPYSGLILEHMNLIATPHLASNTEEMWTDAAREVMRLTSK